MKTLLIAWAVGGWVLLAAENRPGAAPTPAPPHAPGGPTLYENQLEQAQVGTLPAEFMVIDGRFAVAEFDGGKCVELPGAPLESYGFLFGPAQFEDVSVSARIHGTGKGRRFPVFGVSTSGWGGVRFMVAPAKQAVELYQGETLLAHATFEWKSGAWHHLRLQVRRVRDGAWKVDGRVWVQGAPEPATWTVSAETQEAPKPGKPGMLGNPFSGTPIRFDDLKLERAAPE